MKTKKLQKVYSVTSRLQAVVLQSILEQAGISSEVSTVHSNGYLDILTSEENVFDASNILKSTSLSVERTNSSLFGYF